ncbi:hypothetical protein GN325_20710 [Agrobacterium vitis]|uniref:hypothetical protein n=1 Tax=Agrobacterium vitis TaxID=373 RepID=UPI0012E7D291|nr:hypothetical protein [Agrobacterium vitis]MVB04189.1 hypothetical protein [Agrobacterium vitis]NSY10809.1 hypothetical protein [Agrobacterium vitis]
MDERDKYGQLEARITKLEVADSEWLQRRKVAIADARKLEGELALQREKMHTSIIAAVRAVRARGSTI